MSKGCQHFHLLFIKYFQSFFVVCLLFYIKSNKLCQHEKKVLTMRTDESTLFVIGCLYIKHIIPCILINITHAKTNKKHHRSNKVRRQRIQSEEEGNKIKKRGGKKDMD